MILCFTVSVDVTFVLFFSSIKKKKQSTTSSDEAYSALKCVVFRVCINDENALVFVVVIHWYVFWFFYVFAPGLAVGLGIGALAEFAKKSIRQNGAEGNTQKCAHAHTHTRLSGSSSERDLHLTAKKWMKTSPFAFKTLVYLFIFYVTLVLNSSIHRKKS